MHPSSPFPRLLAVGLAMASAWLTSLCAQAYTVQRCEAPDGSLTFTDLSCAEHDTLSFQHAYSPPLGNASAMLPERERSGGVPAQRDAYTNGTRLVIVGQARETPALAAKPASEPTRGKRKSSRATRYSAAE